MMDTRVALIPAYEPQEGLIGIAAALKAQDFIVVVVDDGSGPEYEEVFSRLEKGIVVLSHAVNQGKGRALKTGLSYIKTCFGSHCVVVTVDADGQHSVEDALRVCEVAAMYPGELVLGARTFEGEIPFRSRFGNTLTRGVYRLFTGVAVRDTQTGLRAFQGSLLDELLAMPGKRYEYEMNMLLICAKRGISMREIPIATIYENGNAASHFHAVADSARIYGELLKFSASSFLSFLLDYFLYLLLLGAGTMAGVAGSLWIANVGARVVSGCFNYAVNRRAVFDSEAGVADSALRYAMLAVSILVVNTLLLTLLVSVVGIHAFAAKLIVEGTMFFVSYFAQKRVVFAGKRVGSAG